MKQLNWWRGLWRVWVIGTVFWAVTTFWQSDPRCLINLIDPSTYKRPWCVYRDLECYFELLVSMFVLASAGRNTYPCIALGYRWVFKAQERLTTRGNLIETACTK